LNFDFKTIKCENDMKRYLAGFVKANIVLILTSIQIFCNFIKVTDFETEMPV